MSHSDYTTAPWSNMPHHRVAVPDRDSLTGKVLKILHLRASESEHELWGTGSAKDQARAMLGGTTGSREEISAVLGRAVASSSGARTGRTARLR